MKESDMTQGSVWKVVIKTALPMVVAQIINMLYNIVDRMFVGHIEGVGAVALGGVGICLPISIIVMAFALWIGGGGAPKAAIELGRKNRAKADEIVSTCVLPIFILGVIGTICLLSFGEQILPLFGATKTNLPFALEYMNILSLGIVFSMISTGLNVFINAQGRTLMGMMSVLIGAIINIILDAVFILLLGMGVKGAALATIIGQIVSCIWVLGFLASKSSAIRIVGKHMIPKIKVLGEIMVLGTAAFITTIMESAVTMVLNYVLKKYGAEALLGYAADGSTLAISIGTIITMASSFVLVPISGFTQGVQPVISYNYGAGYQERVKKAVKVSCIICTCYAVLMCGILEVVPRLFTGIFTTDADVIHLSGNLIRTYVSVMFLLGIQMTLQQSFVARGLTKYAIGIALIRKGMYIPLLLLLPRLVSMQNSVNAIYIAEPISDLFAVIGTIGLYLFTYKSFSRQVIPSQAPAAV